MVAQRVLKREVEHVVPLDDVVVAFLVTPAAAAMAKDVHLEHNQISQPLVSFLSN